MLQPGRYEFGEFHIDLSERALFRHGQLVPLTPKALETLLFLVERRGHIVEKDELMKAVWPDTFVEEVSLARNISVLRKVLSDGLDGRAYIETIPKRGYRFVAPVQLAAALPISDQGNGHALAAAATSATLVLPLPLDTVKPARTASSRLLIGALVCALTAAAVLAFVLWKRRAALEAASGPIRSLAVLPLENISRDPEQEYFADGLTEALITDLAKIGSVRVVSRTSIMQYKGVHKPLPQIAQELGVDAVVEGTVSRSGNTVRITAQLLRARNERHLWAEMYERNLGDALSVQGQIAGAVAEQIQLRLSPTEQAQFNKPQPVDPEAYDLYLRGRYYWNKRDPQGLKKSLEYFRLSLEKDPNFALGYAGVADYYIGSVNYLPHAADGYIPAREASMKALQLDENLAEAHASLGFVHFQYDWNWEAAEKEFRRSIELSPSYATAHNWYGYLLAIQGRCDESLRESHAAMQSDPLAMMIRTQLAATLFWCGQTDISVNELKRVVEMSPDFVRGHNYLSIGYVAQGKCDDAMAEYQKSLKLTSGATEREMTAFDAFLDVHCGRPQEARRILQLLRESQPTARPLEFYGIAQVEVALGEPEAAFRDLAEAERQHSNFMVLLKIDPWLVPLHSDPRFQQLLRRMNLS